MPCLLAALAMAWGVGRYARLLRTLAHVDLLLLDDWGSETLTAEQRCDLLEIVEDRHGTRSIVLTSQIPVDRWYDMIGDPTIAGAILSHPIHGTCRIALQGESLRKKRSPDPGTMTA